jgi:hypothetical protein
MKFHEMSFGDFIFGLLDSRWKVVCYLKASVIIAV